MKIEFLDQKGVINVDIQKKYPLVWHETEDGKVVDEFYISPVKGEIEITGDIIVDTGNLKITDCLRLARAIQTLDRINRNKKYAGCRMVADVQVGS